MVRQQPIGIFDSGVGGLSIGRAIRQSLPQEDLIYFADQGFSPYGVKSTPELNERSAYIVDFLIQQGCKAVVVACNTATVNTISELRSKFAIPIIGVEPGIKPAAEQSQAGAVGVLATEQTLKSESFRQLKERYASNARIEAVACPRFVSLVEDLQQDSEQAVAVTEGYVQPLLDKGCDQIVLGCTHFSFLRSAIDQVVDGRADVIDTAEPVAAEVGRRLQQLEQQSTANSAGKAQFWTSGCSEQAKARMSALWGQPLEVNDVRAIS